METPRRERLLIASRMPGSDRRSGSLLLRLDRDDVVIAMDSLLFVASFLLIITGILMLVVRRTRS
jgi:hypothetical protein